VSRLRVPLLGCLVLLAGCNHDTPTEPSAYAYPQHMGIECLLVGSAVECTAWINPSIPPTVPATIVTTWFSSDPSLGAFAGGDGTVTAPARFVPSRRGEVALWAHTEVKVQGRNYSFDLSRWGFLLDPGGAAQYLNSLFGGVVDGSTNVPMAGAEVRILDGCAQGKYAITDASGYFKIDNVLTNQTFTASASAPGYQTQTQLCKVPPPTGSDAGGGSTYAEFQLVRLP
jgi:hypothetical protein